MAAAKADEIEAAFLYWREVHQHPRALLTKERRKAIAERLQEGYTLVQINAAIHGILLSPHHIGQNDRQTSYTDIYHVCKSGRMLEKFVYLWERQQARERHAASSREVAVQERVNKMSPEARAMIEATMAKLKQRGAAH